jgi:hypothetical protein
VLPRIWRGRESRGSRRRGGIEGSTCAPPRLCRCACHEFASASSARSTRTSDIGRRTSDVDGRRRTTTTYDGRRRTSDVDGQRTDDVVIVRPSSSVFRRPSSVVHRPSSVVRRRLSVVRRRSSAHTRTHKRTDAHARARTSTHAHTHKRMYARTHTHTHTHALTPAVLSAQHCVLARC